MITYRPDADLFRIQLESIRDQTRRDFRCIISEDGDEERTQALVAEIVGDDPRYEVIGFSDNLGFYHNVERALAAVPDDVGWVALADQDDRWYPEKLERLVPLLDDSTLAMNQARVVRWPSGEVLIEKSTRTVVPAADLTIANQVTGSFSVFRRGLLDVALPFPDLRTFTTFHDHWIGVCAAATGGYVVLDEALQDYVQHGNNVVGEFLPRTERSRVQALRHRPGETVRGARDLAEKYEGEQGVVACLRVHANGSFGWRRAMVDLLEQRVPSLPPDLATLAHDLAPSAGVRGVVNMFRTAYASPNVSTGAMEAFVAGLPYELSQRTTAAGRLRRFGAARLKRGRTS